LALDGLLWLEVGDAGRQALSLPASWSQVSTGMRCFVYRSEKRAEAYVYLREQDAFDLLPEAVRASLWPLTFALSFELGPERRLARVDAEVVRANLAQDGFHVQLPPQIFHLPDNRPAHAG
jgi:hypothetical protein